MTGTLGEAPLDPAALAVLAGRLASVADEVGAVLRRGAFSPNIKERADCSAAVFDPRGRLLAQAEHIPVHLGSMPAAVSAAIAAVGTAVRPGEQIVSNDPYAGGTHLNDVTFVAPCVVDGELVGWVANRAHHADLGGMAPGSMPAAAEHIAQEGLRVPPVRWSDAVRAIVVAASRTPEERAGDLDAQLGANAVGVLRFAELAGAPFHEVLDYGERRMRAALAALPEGTVEVDDELDSAGPEPHQRRPARLHLRLELRAGEVRVDLTGSDDQVPGPVNAVRAVTVSAVTFALRSVVDPDLPTNAGVLRPLRVVTRPGSVCDARFPAAVGAGNVEVSQRIADLCLSALAELAPGRVPAASQGTMNNLMFGGRGWAYYETIGGGQGGRPGRAGMSGVHTNMTNTADTPVEALERSLPLRVRSYRLRAGSGGAGRFPGGDGIHRELEVLSPAVCTLITERRRRPPAGAAGGGPGAVGENWLLPGGDETRARRLPDKCTVRLAPGDVIRILTPGGGGWGPPDPAA
jgi:N-methylhydantoinase B/oxoprolinase/acetone carboxylase alpha subunit